MPIDISIVIPAYNAEQFIEKALNGIKHQVYLPAQVVIVNDGSTDNTLQVIETWLSKNKISFAIDIITQSNAGLSAARNLGIRKATGTLIALLDADDFYYPDFLKTAASVFLADPAVDIFFANQKVVNLENVKVHEWLESKNIRRLKQRQLFDNILLIEENMLPSLYDGNYISCSACVMVKQSIEDAGGFNESIQQSEDLDFFLRFLPEKRITFTYEELSEVLRHADSITQTRCRHMNISAVVALQSHSRRLKAPCPIINKVIKQKLHAAIFQASIVSIVELRNFAQQAKMLDPSIKPNARDWLRSIYYTFK